MTGKQKYQLKQNQLRERSELLFDLLKPHYPDLSPPLHYRNDFELLIAVILSAQTTDAGVNKVTPNLFQRYSRPENLAIAEREDVEKIIHSLGFYKQKAKNIIETAQMLYELGGKVPSDWETLLSFPGVGRKTASVIRSHLFDLPAIIVDTHFKRVSRRLDLTDQTNPDKIEEEMSLFIPDKIRSDFSMVLNFHGRRICKAKNPECFHCPVAEYCSQAVISV